MWKLTPLDVVWKLTPLDVVWKLTPLDVVWKLIDTLGRYVDVMIQLHTDIGAVGHNWDICWRTDSSP